MQAGEGGVCSLHKTVRREAQGCLGRGREARPLHDTGPSLQPVLPWTPAPTTPPWLRQPAGRAAEADRMEAWRASWRKPRPGSICRPEVGGGRYQVPPEAGLWWWTEASMRSLVTVLAGRRGRGARGQLGCPTDPPQALGLPSPAFAHPRAHPSCSAPTGSACGSFRGSPPPAAGAEFLLPISSAGSAGPQTLALGVENSEPLQDGSAATPAGRQTLSWPSPLPCSLHSFAGSH